MCPGGLGSGRLTLQSGAADGEGDVDIAPRGPRVGAGFVRPGHEVTGQAPVDLGRVQVERRRETEAAACERADADARSDPGTRQVELAPGGDPQQRRLEAGGIAHGEQLLGIGPRTARTAHLAGHVEVDFEAAVARAAVTFATARDGRLRGVEDLIHRVALLSIGAESSATLGSSGVAKSCSGSNSLSGIRSIRAPSAFRNASGGSGK